MKICEICKKKLRFWQKKYWNFHFKCYFELEECHLNNLQLLSCKNKEIEIIKKGFEKDLSKLDKNYYDFIIIFYPLVREFDSRCICNLICKNKLITITSSEFERITLHRIFEKLGYFKDKEHIFDKNDNIRTFETKLKTIKQ